ncbi:hypothetical protein SASPL_117236 [Salvia splendens]|uniref:GAG-pre-integrase domain-containing protein n=1 Tax=Salvia splendens TaxID=180675 RepID=A0A8X8XXI5_SALSN|nr:hypothetical protein SASPL_117236 [Salvia splendens]
MSLTAGVMGAFFLFSGYFLTTDSIPKCWNFMQYLSVFKYPYESFVINEFGGEEGRAKCMERIEGQCLIYGHGFLIRQGLKVSQKWINLFMMMSFIIGYRFLGYVFLCNKKDAEATKLWHMRLGHAGERSLQILAKQGLLKEVWSDKPATDYDSLRIFGSIAYYHVNESKLDPRAKKALFMGFSVGVKGYRLWCLESKKTIVRRDVTFDESSMLNKVNPNSSDTSQQVEYTPKQVEFEEAIVIPTTNTTNDSPMEEEESDNEEVPPQEPSQQSEPIAVRRTRRENKKPARFADMVAYALPVVDNVPCIFSKGK